MRDCRHRPRLFIRASGDAEGLARAVRANLGEHADCTVWTRGTLEGGRVAFESLLDVVADVDLGIFVLDAEETGGALAFDLGLFVGRLGPGRAFVIRPDRDGAPPSPAELIGIPVAGFDPAQGARDPAAALEGACLQIRRRLAGTGSDEARADVEVAAGPVPYVAAICVRKNGTRPEILLIESTRGRRIFPKGRIRPGEAPDDAALRYAYSEGGVMGHAISEESATFHSVRDDHRQERTVAAVLVEATSSVAPKAGFRRPCWFDLATAEQALARDWEGAQMGTFRQMIRWAAAQIRLGPGARNQAGAVPFRQGKDGLEVLLVTSRTRRAWIIPKGNIKSGASARETAACEALEEAGVEGRMLDAPIGQYRYERLGVRHDVTVFALEVLREHEDWPEKAGRRRRWMSLDEASTVAEYEHVKEVLVRFGQVVGAGAA